VEVVREARRGGEVGQRGRRPVEAEPQFLRATAVGGTIEPARGRRSPGYPPGPSPTRRGKSAPLPLGELTRTLVSIGVTAPILPPWDAYRGGRATVIIRSMR
jgi:hypothetical protein